MLNIRTQRDLGVTEGQTIRPPSTALLTIDSADRFTDQINRRDVLAYNSLSDGPAVPRNYSAYDFAMNKNESIMNGFFTRLAVTEVVFPWVIPNINIQTRGIGVEFETSAGVSGEVVINLADGFYTPAELAFNIQSEVRQIDASLNQFNMVYSIAPFTNQMIYDTSDLDVSIAFHPLSYSDVSNSFFANNSQVLQLFDLLGFTDVNEITQPTYTGLPTLCQFTRYVDIVCPQLIYNQSLKDTSSQRTVRDALCRIYLGNGDQMTTATVDPADPNYCPPGCAPVVIYRNFSMPKQIQWIPNQPVPGYLQFQVYDDNGVLLSNSGAFVPDPDQSIYNINPGVDWSMTLLVSEN